MIVSYYHTLIVPYGCEFGSGWGIFFSRVFWASAVRDICGDQVEHRVYVAPFQDEMLLGITN